MGKIFEELVGDAALREFDSVEIKARSTARSIT